MHLNADIKARNVFDIQVKDAQTGKLKQQLKAFNTITKRFVDLWSRGDSYFLRDIAFGTGQGKPSFEDTALFKWLGNKTATTAASETKLPVLSITRTVRLAAEEFIGQTITEVGFSYSKELQTHAMIVDSEGQPIAIQKTGTDIIDIYATVYFELPTPSELGPGAQWIQSTQLFSTFLRYSWNPNILLFEEYPQESSDGTVILNTVNTILTKTAPGTALPDNAARNYSIRILETEANKPIKSVNFNNLLQLDLSDVSPVWKGKTFTDSQVAIGDGTTKDFNIPHQEFEDLTLKINGQELALDDYVVNGHKTPEQFHSQVVGRAELPGLLTEKKQWLKRICFSTQHPTEQNRIILAFPNVDNTAVVVYSIEIGLKPFSSTIVDSFTFAAPTDNVTASASDWNTKFIGNDILFIGWGREGILLKDFVPATGKFGQEWTRHANFPKITPDTASYYENRPELIEIPGSNFVFMHLQWPIYRQSRLEELKSFSLNRTTKVFGENVNQVTVLPTQTTQYGIHQISPHPTEPFLVLSTNSGRFHEIMPYEPTTGLFGTPLDGYLNTKEDNPRLISWDPTGEMFIVSYDGHNNRNASLFVGQYDKQTQQIVDITSRFPSTAVQDNTAKRIFLPNGEILIQYTRSSAHEILHVRMKADGSYTILGTYTYEGMLSTLGGGPGFYVVGDYILWIEGRYESSTNYGNTQGPFVFTPLQHIVDKHITLKNPLPADAKLTATYHVPYIPKTKDYVLDLSVTYSITGV